MEIVRAKEVEIPAFGLFVRRKIKITCGNCNITFEDKPTISKDMYSKCPYCEKINKLSITEA